jgi:hypothetical protein
MSWQTERRDRIAQIVALCVKNNITPNNAAFADFVIRVSEARFGVRRETSKSYIAAILSAWRYDKWKTILQENVYLQEAEKQKWIQTH